MKIKIIAVLSIALFIGLVGCKSANTNTNTANANTNSNMAVATATPTMAPTAATNPALKTTIEDALKKKGFKDITVDTSTTPATLRGTYAKGKLAEVIQTAQQANGGKPVKNEATEMK